MTWVSSGGGFLVLILDFDFDFGYWILILLWILLSEGGWCD